MSTPAKVISKKGKKKPVPVKTSLNNPYSLQWSPLENEHVDFILKTLKDKITDVGLQKKRVKKFREWGRSTRKRASKCSEEGNKPVAESAESTQKPTEPCWTNSALRKQLAIGINEVTKGLERNELSLVLVCNSVMPSHMTCHLIPLSKTRSVPACQVRRLSAHLSGLLGLKCVLALGFKRDAAEFADVVSAITPVVPPLNVAWVPTDSSPITTEVEGCGSEKHTDSAKAKKRKLEEISGEASEALILQPLKVKKIIPNPNKIRKQKKKEKKK
ncbi:ribonuclease P protein subunit p38 [Xyrauchen texanus]|uniref:ribonuclease P protein subunit p38 n=1 Tax=Xyrauchen texanus TaxID=154827 RepID=UPI0022423F27|nr:ribonuclease P protein subunit p38 [Xyrauchen texanus]